MWTSTLISLAAKREKPFVAIPIRVSLYFSVLLATAFLPCFTPNNGPLNSAESETPIDQDEATEEATLKPQARTPIGGHRQSVPFSISVRDRHDGHTSDNLSAPHSGHRHSGHRLPNDFMAPSRI